MKRKQNVAQGFTIIEVLIVLAIVGLILAIFLLAIPQLQRNSRNHQRKSDAQRLLVALLEYKTNNNNRLPGSQYGDSYGPRSRFIRNIIPNGTGADLNEVILPLYDHDNDPLTPEAGFDDPSVGPYTVTYGPSVTGLGHMDWLPRVKCLDEAGWKGSYDNIYNEPAVFVHPDAITGRESDIAVMLTLEPYNDPSRPILVYCIDNVEF